MNLADLSIKRPTFITCIVLVMLAVGYWCLNTLGVDLFPNVTFPVVVVSTPYPGASPSEIETQVRQQISKVASGGAQIDSIFFSGNGEPTLHPEFDEVVEKVKTIRDEFFAKVPLGVLTNGAHLDSRKVQKAMALLDLRVVKLNAGNDRTILKINAPLVKETAESLFANARKIKNLILQSCFVQGVADNTAQEDLEDWMESVGMIKPELVQIYTLDRVPTASGLIKCDEDTLYTIAAKLEKRTRTRWKVFYN